MAVIAHLNGRPLLLLVDTGSTHIALDPDIIVDLRLPPISLPQPPLQLAAGRAEPTATTLYRLHETSVGSLTIRNLEVVPLTSPRALAVHGVLGMNFLAHFLRVTLNLAALTLELDWEEQ